MRFQYYSDTDSLYIDLSNKTCIDSNEVVPGIVLDFDNCGNITGIDIDRASTIVDLSRLEIDSLPLTHFSIAAQK